MLDVFKGSAFETRTLTNSFIKLPYKPARIGELGLFRESGIRTLTALVEEKNGQLSLIKTSERGGAGGNLVLPKRKVRPFQVQHLEKNATIYADEVQGVRAFGSETELESVQALVNDRLAVLRAEHEVTLEHMRITAVQGLVKDADGSTIHDLFDEFDVSQQTATLTVNTSTDNGNALRKQIIAAQRLVEAELGATPISTYRAFCGADFYDLLTSDLGVTQTLRWADPGQLLQQEANIRRFNFGGVAWEEYRGSVSGQPFVPASKAFLYPEGAPIFETYFGPADFIEAVNTLGLPMYAKIVFDDELNRYVTVHTQSNPLVLCVRPRAVIELSITT